MLILLLVNDASLVATLRAHRKTAPRAAKNYFGEVWGGVWHKASISEVGGGGQFVGGGEEISCKSSVAPWSWYGMHHHSGGGGGATRTGGGGCPPAEKALILKHALWGPFQFWTTRPARCGKMGPERREGLNLFSGVPWEYSNTHGPGCLGARAVREPSRGGGGGSVTKRTSALYDVSDVVWSSFVWDQTCHWRHAGQRVLSSDRPRIKGHSVLPAPLHYQNSVGTCCVRCAAP